MTEQAGIDWAALHARLAAAMEGLERGFAPDAAEVDRRLRERAARLARVTAAPAAVDEIQVLEFDLAGRRHAVDSRFVRDVCAGQAPTPVPRAPSWAAGIAHLRGEFLTILDFQALVGMADAAGGVGASVIVLQQGGLTIGLAADAIVGLCAVARAGLDPVPATAQGSRRFYLGVTQTGTLVLDAGAFFDEGVLSGTDGTAAGRGN